MTNAATLTIPGAEGIVAAYADMRRHNVAPLVAQDWLIEQVRTIARDDILDQVGRNHGQPAETPVATDERTMREIHRALNIAVAVYNRQRGRVTELDHITTGPGAAAINRAAAIRATRSSDTERALLVTPLHIDMIQTHANKAAHYVAGMLRIGNRIRAISARLESSTYRAPTVRLTHFDVLMP